MSVNKTVTVKKRNGRLEPLDVNKINKCAERACEGLDGVSASEIVIDAHVQLFDKVLTSEIDKALINSARSKIKKEPNYSYAAARLLANTVYKEVFGEGVDHDGFDLQYRKSFIINLKKLAKVDRIDPRLLSFDLKKLADALVLENDQKFKYLGLQTLYDRYFIHIDNRRMESPQAFWMRVAMGLSVNEKNKEEAAIKFYNIMSNFLYCPSTPTLFNSGTCHPQLSSCYLSTVEDSIDGIFGTIHGQARLSKYAGGLGVDWTPIRATGSYIKGTNGKSQGLIPWLKIFNSTLVAVNQCFAPQTMVYTASGLKEIKDVVIGDLVLGKDGEYRPVTKVHEYEQGDDPMVRITTEHSNKSVDVTSGHPIMATLGDGSNENSRIDWIEAKDLTNEYSVAIPIPSETVPVDNFYEDDARFYGTCLGDGVLSGSYFSFYLSNVSDVEKINFIKSYLDSKKCSYEKIDGTYCLIKFNFSEKIPFKSSDIYNDFGEKKISSKFAHLSLNQSVAMMAGILQNNGVNYSIDKKYSLINSSFDLVEGIRYQCLRNSCLATIEEQEDKTDRIGKSYVLSIPAFEILTEKLGQKEYSTNTGVSRNGFLFSKVKSVNQIKSCPLVYDLEVDGVESYATSGFLAHNGGKRHGAGCSYLETWHLDIEDFIDLRKNTGDDRRRCHDMNTANWIPDLFMKQIKIDGPWYLFSPSDVPDLHDLFGDAFEKRYWEYVEKTKTGELKHFREINAKTLWKKMLTSLFQTGHPWITFKDPSNIRYSNQHVGAVHSSNLCTEILLHSKPTIFKDGKVEEIGETAVCNLGSLNLISIALSSYINDKFNFKEFKENVKRATEIAVRMLNNVIDINFYPTEEARNSNLSHRPVGLGVMGFHDLLHELDINYESKEAIELSGEIQETISHAAVLTSSILAKEQGTYSTYRGSLWDRGILPIDSYNSLMQFRGKNEESKGKLDWTNVREHVKEYGVRNSNTFSVAPTATISYIHGCSQSIEPDYSMLYVYSTLSGEFTMANEYFVKKMKSLGLWNQSLINALHAVDGDITKLDLPNEIKNQFKGAFAIDQKKLIDCAAERQKWIDMGQSLNLYSNNPSLKGLNEIYMHAWESGLKTTYYLRSQAASKIEKSTIGNTTTNDLEVKPTEEEVKACSLEAARNGTVCEACQ